jgi:hypothetical protein
MYVRSPTRTGVRDRSWFGERVEPEWYYDLKERGSRFWRTDWVAEEVGLGAGGGQC